MSKNKVTFYIIDGIYEEDDDQEFYFEGIKIIIQRSDGSYREYLKPRTNWWACYFQTLNNLEKLELWLFPAPPSEEVLEEEKYKDFPALYTIYDGVTKEVWYIVGKDSDDAISKLPKCVSHEYLEWEAARDEEEAEWWMYTVQYLEPNRIRCGYPLTVLANSFEMSEEIAKYLSKADNYYYRNVHPVCGL